MPVPMGRPPSGNLPSGYPSHRFAMRSGVRGSYARGMEGTVGAPPQRVCPKCARISWATGPQCPYCTARFSRSGEVRPWMLVLTGAIVLVGVAIMLVIAGNQFDSKLNDRVDEVNRELDANFKQITTHVQKQLRAVPPPGGTLPTETPTPFA